MSTVYVAHASEQGGPALQLAASIMAHLEALEVALQSLAVAPDGTVTVTTSSPIPDDQLAHLGLEVLP